MQRLALTLIAVLSGVGLLVGWWTFWFLTDDAYIAFRYVGNSVDGYGYVWNPPPFLPVEGYTSFLWVVLLDGVWRLLGIPPTVSSNPIALLFSAGTLLVVAAMVMRMRAIDDRAWTRIGFLCLVSIGCLTNRTFLAWTSSGLETALFNFLFIAWFYLVAFRAREDRPGVWALVCLTAALTYLARPDGLLHAAASGLLVVHWIGGRIRTRRAGPRAFLAALPLLLAPAHLLWRRWFYGEWLPNTYVAKYSAPWPESGVRYLGSFLLEYALWIPILAVSAVLAGRVVRHLRDEDLHTAALRSLRDTARNPQLGMAVGTVLVHFAYYTFVIGGDHFEYRVYSHLIPLLMIATIWALTRLNLGALPALACFAVFLVCSWPIPWTHWSKTHELFGRKDTVKLAAPVAPDFPGPLRWYAEAFDSMQTWLIERSICMRHQEHKAFHEYMKGMMPTREEGRAIDAGAYPVMAVTGVGVLGWVYPQINLLDRLGLNDYVVARNRANTENRQMAHDRLAPRAYLEAFRPNVHFRPERRVKIVVERRALELLPAEIEEIERSWRKRAKKRRSVPAEMEDGGADPKPDQTPVSFLRLERRDRPERGHDVEVGRLVGSEGPVGDQVEEAPGGHGHHPGQGSGLVRLDARMAADRRRPHLGNLLPRARAEPPPGVARPRGARDHLAQRETGARWQLELQAHRSPGGRRQVVGEAIEGLGGGLEHLLEEVAGDLQAKGLEVLEVLVDQLPADARGFGERNHAEGVPALLAHQLCARGQELAAPLLCRQVGAGCSSFRGGHPYGPIVSLLDDYCTPCII
jgi:arabinofuranosyltransferase